MLCGDSRFYFLYGSGASYQNVSHDDLRVRPLTVTYAPVSGLPPVQ